MSDNFNVENVVTTHRSDDKIRNMQYQMDNERMVIPVDNLEPSLGFVEAPSVSVCLLLESCLNGSPLETLMNSELTLYNKVLAHIKDAVKDHEGIDALSAGLEAYHGIDPQTVT